jgi:hypothetical protein
MTGRTEIELALDRYLSEGAERVPDRVVDAALDQIDQTTQRRAVRVPRRFRDMPTFLKPALAGAALIAVLVVGGAVFLNGGGRPPTGTQPTRPAATRPTSGSSPSAAATDSSPSVAAPASSTPLRPLGLAIVNLDGTVRQDLGLPRDAWSADLSADGSKVAFPTRSMDVITCGGCELSRHLVAVPVGSVHGDLLLSNSRTVVDASTVAQPAWSPDGTKVAFVAAAVGETNLDIWVVSAREADLGEPASRLRLTTSRADDAFPAWSPDGKTIYYDNAGSEALDDSGFSPTQEIWSLPAAGGEPRRLTSNTSDDSQADVSADGRIAYHRDGAIWVMGADGRNQDRLDPTQDLGFSPRWSPDGRKLAVLRFDPDERAILDASLGLQVDNPMLDVVVFDLETHRITDTGQRVPSDLNPPSWLPDGTGLLVYRYDEGR